MVNSSFAGFGNIFTELYLSKFSEVVRTIFSVSEITLTGTKQPLRLSYTMDWETYNCQQA